MSAFNIIVTHTLNDPWCDTNRSESGSITRGMIRERAVELAEMNGRKPHEACKSDWETAKHEMIGSPKT
jgi:Protein of unknown function (DUF2934)